MGGSGTGAPPKRPAGVRKRGPRWVDLPKVFGVGIVLLIVGSLVIGAIGPSLGTPRSPSAGELSDDAARGIVDGGLATELRARVEAAPEDAAAAAGLANLLAADGRAAEAVDFHERAVGLEPSNAQYWLDFGATLREMARPADAELQYRRALEIEPANGSARLGLAAALEAADPPRAAEAAVEYRRLIDDPPGSFYAEEAQRALDRLAGVAATPAVPAAGSP